MVLNMKMQSNLLILRIETNQNYLMREVLMDQAGGNLKTKRGVLVFALETVILHIAGERADGC